MNFSKAAMMGICLFATDLAFADSVVTYVESAVGKRAPASYLKADAIDNAYVYVTAQLENPAGSQCVEPAGTDAIGSLFIKSNLDLAITVQPQGFFGVDQKKEIPVASYNFSNDAKYCKSSWRQAVVIVPPTPFGVPPPGANSTSGVSLVVQFRSSAKPSLSILEPIQALLGVSSALATGGAANTVVGLAKIANGPAVDILSKEFENRRKTEAEGTYVFPISWAEIASGIQEKKLVLINGKRSFYDSAKTAIDRIKANPNDAANAQVLSITLSLNTRKSVFVTDASLVRNLPVVSQALSSTAILNFPKIAGVPNLYQRIQAEAPASIKDVRENKPGACNMMLATITELGFNKLDRALIMGAILDQADGGSNAWRSETDAFFSGCFGSEASISTTLTSVYGDGYFTRPTPPVNLTDSEVFTAKPATWPAAIEKYLSKMRQSLYFTGENRVALLDFPAAVKNISAGSIYGASDIEFSEDIPLNSAKLTDVFRTIPILKIGYIFGYKFANETTWRGAMLVTTKLKSGAIEPYLLELTFNASAQADPATPSYVSLLPILSDMGANYAAVFEQMPFRPTSMCGRAAGVSGATVLKSLRREAPTLTRVEAPVPIPIPIPVLADLNID